MTSEPTNQQGRSVRPRAERADDVVASLAVTLDLTIMPEAIGDGMPLFTAPDAGPVKVIESVPCSDGALRVFCDTTDR